MKLELDYCLPASNVKECALLPISRRTKKSGIGVLVDDNGQHSAHETLEGDNIRDNLTLHSKQPLTI